MKRRIFTTLAIFAALALTACGGKPAEGSKQASKPATSSKHVHTYDENKWENDANQHWHPATCEHTDQKGSKANHKWVSDPDLASTDVAATCKQTGLAHVKCEVCGYKTTQEIAKTDHTFGEWVVKDATCGEAGTRSHKCTVCDFEESETLGKLPHSWTVSKEVAKTGEDDVAYNEVECSVCHAKGIMVAAASATIHGGTPKTAPEGCIKLASNDDYMEVKFVLEAAKTGTLYQRGSMDYWYEDSNNNQNKTYYSQNSGHTDASTKKGNFKIEVGPDAANLAEVELPDDTDMTFGDMLPQDGASEVGGHQWSQIGDCIVGAVSLSAGSNVLRFTRVDSYNLAVHDFLVVFDAAA